MISLLILLKLSHKITEVIVGVNKYKLPNEEPVEVLSINNSAVIQSQVINSTWC